MSTYNESEEELSSSINSILKQTYSNIEFIIVNDNPKNNVLNHFLSSIKDERLHILTNPRNFGLVYSLNRAWRASNGDVIARMDADDISVEDRLENQLDLLQKEDYDLLGCDIRIVNEVGKTLSDHIYFPTVEKEIKKYIYWYNCIAHPTWMVKRNLYENLGGYRNISYCEDYDFILRTIGLGYKVGNMSNVGLIYKIRCNGISKSNHIDQYLLKHYLAHNMKNIVMITEQQIESYRRSQKFKKKKEKYTYYNKHKDQIKGKKFDYKTLINIFCNPYLYINILETIMFNKCNNVNKDSLKHIR